METGKVITFTPMAYEENKHLLTAENTTASLCITGYSGKYILVKTVKRGWNNPGGHIELGETADEAVIREVKEESGCELVKYKPIALLESDRDLAKTYLVVYVGVVEKFDETYTKVGEITEIGAFTKEEYLERFHGDKKLLEEAFEELEKLLKNQL